jgi:hypothetical protein
MDFDYSEEQQMLREGVERLIKDRYQFEDRKKYLKEAPGYSKAMWAQYAEMGLLGLPFEERYGGSGGGAVETMIVMEAFGRGLILEPYLATVLLGGRTVQLTETGEVECVRYDPAPLADGHVRIRTVRSVISSGTEMTFYGKGATNVYLHKRWNEELRLFEVGTASMAYPLVIGYRAAGQVTESRAAGVALGTRVYGNWRHTEFTSVPAEAGKDVVEAAIAEVYKEMKTLREEPVDEEELLLVRNYMMGSILGDLDGPFQIIARWKNIILNGMDENYFYTSINTIRSISAADLQELAQKYLVPEDFYDLVVI